jgi:transferase CAF17, mitochondrial
LLPIIRRKHVNQRFTYIKGRVLHDIFVYTQTNANGQRGYLVEHETHSLDAPSLLTLMKRHVLRSKVRIRDVSEEYNVWAAWGSEQENLWDTNRRWMWARSGAVEPVWDPSERPWGAEDYAMKDRRAAGMGNRLLVKNGERRMYATLVPCLVIDDSHSTTIIITRYGIV